MKANEIHALTDNELNNKLTELKCRRKLLI